MANPFATFIENTIGSRAKVANTKSNFDALDIAFSKYFPSDKKDFRKGTVTWVGETSGTGSAYVATPRNSATVEGANESGTEVVFSPHVANAKGATLNYADGGARLIVDAAGTPLNPNELSVDLIYSARLNTAGVGTWQLLGTVISNPAASESSGWAISSVAPATPTKGDGWYDTSADQLKAYDGSAWVVVGEAKGVFKGYYSHDDNPFEDDQYGRIRAFDGIDAQDSATTDWTVIDKLQFSSLSSNAAFGAKGENLSGFFDGVEEGGILILSITNGEVAYRITADSVAKTNGYEIAVEYVYEYEDSVSINLSDDLTVKINPRSELVYDFNWVRSSTAPVDPEAGQGWYDTADEELKIYNGTAWKKAINAGVFDLHEDITNEIVSLMGADRLIVSDEDQTGQPNKWLSLTKLKTWLQGVLKLGTARITSGVFDSARLSGTGAATGRVLTKTSATQTWQQIPLFDLHDDISTEMTAPAGADRLAISDESINGDPNRWLSLTRLKTWLQSVLSFPFGLHDDVSTEMTAPNGSDRLVVSDESANGDPNRWFTLTRFKTWLIGAISISSIGPEWARSSALVNPAVSNNRRAVTWNAAASIPSEITISDTNVSGVGQEVRIPNDWSQDISVFGIWIKFYKGSVFLNKAVFAFGPTADITKARYQVYGYKNSRSTLSNATVSFIRGSSYDTIRIDNGSANPSDVWAAVDDYTVRIYPAGTYLS